MKKKIKYSFFITFLLILILCFLITTFENEVSTSSNENFITSFKFEVSKNSTLPKDVIGTIIGTKWYTLCPECPLPEKPAIVAIAPSNTDLSSLKPTIMLSEGTAVLPESGIALDFTNLITYTVTATDGSTQDYPVLVVVDKPIIPGSSEIDLYVSNDGNDKSDGLSREATKQTIKSAVKAAKDGDIIFVLSGSYFEDIIIDKPISLIGENRDTTTIKGSGSGDVIYVSSNNVTINSFTVQNSGLMANRGSCCPPDRDYAAIELNNVSNCTVSNNKTRYSEFGILLWSSSDNTVENNSVYLNEGDGIYLYESCNRNKITNNVSYKNGGHGGIFLIDSNKKNTITNNILLANHDHGIKLHKFSDNNLIDGNVLINNGDAIWIGYCNYNTITNNIAKSHSRGGIELYWSNFNIISSNTTESNFCGIKLECGCYHNTIENNVVSSNSGWGMALRLSSNHNKFTSNQIISNKNGIYIQHASYNTFNKNNISSNEQRLVIEDGIIKQDGEHDWEEFVNLEGPWKHYAEPGWDVVLEAQMKLAGEPIEGETSTENTISDE